MKTHTNRPLIVITGSKLNKNKRLEILITNKGDQIAKNIKAISVFPAVKKGGEYPTKIENDSVLSLLPGESMVLVTKNPPLEYSSIFITYQSNRWRNYVHGASIVSSIQNAILPAGVDYEGYKSVITKEQFEKVQKDFERFRFEVFEPRGFKSRY